MQKGAIYFKWEDEFWYKNGILSAKGMFGPLHVWWEPALFMVPVAGVQVSWSLPRALLCVLQTQPQLSQERSSRRSELSTAL